MMETLKIDTLLLKAIISTNQNQTMPIKIGGTKSNPTTLINGLRQGSALSFTLFMIYMLSLANEPEILKNISFFYADDTIMISQRNYTNHQM